MKKYTTLNLLTSQCVIVIAISLFISVSGFSSDRGSRAEGLENEINNNNLAIHEEADIEEEEGVLVVRHNYGDLSNLDEHVNVRYEVGLLKLALEKTVKDYGPYKLKGVNKGYITHLRAMEQINQKSIKNYVKVLGYNEEKQSRHNMEIAKFPVYLGLLSYRSCFTSANKLDGLSKMKDIRDLVGYSQATGIGWTDAKIMMYNGLSVNEVPNREAIYKMLVANRVDLYCRGTNEALQDYQNNKNIDGIAYDRSFAIHYPNPHFFHTHKDNIELIERLEIGLIRAFNDDSLITLWDAAFRDSVQFVNMKSRKLFVLDNPLIGSLPLEYSEYDFVNL